MTDTITSLIEKLEGADPNDAWVFAPDVHIAFFGGSLGKAARCPKYTTSLDAALALAERVLPGWTWGIDNHCGRHKSPFAHVFKSLKESNHSWAATAPLALCAAILKAKEPTQ